MTIKFSFFKFLVFRKYRLTKPLQANRICTRFQYIKQETMTFPQKTHYDCCDLPDRSLNMILDYSIVRPARDKKETRKNISFHDLSPLIKNVNVDFVFQLIVYRIIFEI